MNAWAQNFKSTSHVQVIYLVSLCELSPRKVLLCNSRLVECEKRSPITNIDVCQHRRTLKGHFNLMICMRKQDLINRRGIHLNNHNMEVEKK